MIILKSFSYILLAFFTLKFITLFINENIVALKEQLSSKKIEDGLLSIQDLQPSNIERFSVCCENFLKSKGYKEITKVSEADNIINFTAKLKDTSNFIRCISCDFSEIDSIDDFSLKSSQNHIDSLLGYMAYNFCSNGLLISNSNFSEDINLKDNIKLINGYELTNTIRNLVKENF